MVQLVGVKVKEGSLVALRYSTSKQLFAWAIALSLSPSVALAATLVRATAGTFQDGTKVEAITLTDGRGISARILTYGARLENLYLPDRHGVLADVVLGHDQLSDYENTRDFFGATVGRYANRIARARFSLDGHAYVLDANEGANLLHGGPRGFDRVNWQVASVTAGSSASVVLTHQSPDGDQGFPGQVDASVEYRMDDTGDMTVIYRATTTKPTVINMSSHALFNLAGEGGPRDALGEILTIPASAYTPLRSDLIPTGELKPVAGTVFDFRHGRVLADGIRDGSDPQIRIGHGYDHNFVLDKGVTAKPELVARLEDPLSGRVLEISSTEPGLQLYSGNFLAGTDVGKHGHLYRMGDGIALEPQKFPDSPNEPGFPSARVDPGKPYLHVMTYHFTVSTSENRP